jgi:hypothetical protein
MVQSGANYSLEADSPDNQGKYREFFDFQPDLADRGS